MTTTRMMVVKTATMATADSSDDDSVAGYVIGYGTEHYPPHQSYVKLALPFMRPYMMLRKSRSLLKLGLFSQ